MIFLKKNHYNINLIFNIFDILITLFWLEIPRYKYLTTVKNHFEKIKQL